MNGEPKKKRELEIVYTNARNGHYELWTSTLAMVEVRRLKEETNDQKPLSEEHLKKINDLFRQPFVKPIPLAVDIADHARELWRTIKGLGKWQDAIHLASALRWNAEFLHTYDRDDLLHLDMMFTCRNGEKLTICYPDETTDGPLFAKGRK
ncbi:MAG: PIN domain-containing protein [Alphaproteobacteria bacterium]|nr:PIN domain-containing protein [Alphaproteobacteria bacterium]